MFPCWADCDKGGSFSSRYTLHIMYTPKLSPSPTVFNGMGFRTILCTSKYVHTVTNLESKSYLMHSYLGELT